MEWDDPEDIELVSRTFDAWAAAVVAKDRATVESFHDDGFRTGLGKRSLTKAEHVLLELTVGVQEMSIISIDATRRMGDMLLVWSKHLIRASEVPPIPELGLEGDWGDEAAAKGGFSQAEFTLWRQEGDSLKCLVFQSARSPD